MTRQQAYLAALAEEQRHLLDAEYWQAQANTAAAELGEAQLRYHHARAASRAALEALNQETRQRVAATSSRRVA